MEDHTVDICLIVPPFASVHYPQLGTAILKSACVARGFSVRIVHANLALAGRVGLSRYDVIPESTMRAMIGDLVFRPHAYPADVTAQLPPVPPLSEDQTAMMDAVADDIGPALDALTEEILALRPRIVGMSSMFQQNLACGAISRLIKEAAPDICVVMGGANAAWPLSAGLAKAFPWIDHFFAGESDIDFPDFCERLLRDGERPAEKVIRSEPINDMRAVFAPDFSDYFAQLRPLQASGVLPEWLPRFLTAEGSRGCWWGAKHHCTFCGLNADGMDFRDKAPSRMKEELTALQVWGIDKINLTDNIMPRRYLTELLPDLADNGPHYEMFYEVKSNLTDAQIDTMALAGVTIIQPGIESLSTDVLKLMRKGVSGHQNIALLRSCSAVGIEVKWGVIFGFPGETAAQYAAMIALMPKLSHMHPPSYANRILIDRFSPFYMDPEGMGVAPITPAEGYRPLYPADLPTEEIAYHFRGDYTTELLGDPELLASLHAAVADWNAAWSAKTPPILQVFETASSILVFDTRGGGRPNVTPLSAEQFEALVKFERPLPSERLDEALAAHGAWLLERDFLIDHEGKLMSIVVRPRHEVAKRIAAGRSTHVPLAVA